jgi:hypothetical protein
MVAILGSHFICSQRLIWGWLTPSFFAKPVRLRSFCSRNCRNLSPSNLILFPDLFASDVPQRRVGKTTGGYFSPESDIPLLIAHCHDLRLAWNREGLHVI